MAEITVYDFPGLRNAIQSGIDMIYLGSDIAFTSSGGATIPRNMGSITIDGQGFTINDYNSATLTDTLRISTSSGNDLTITIQNVVWKGSNYYGLVYIPDSANASNITLVYNNVDYTGVQAISNRWGTTRLVDSKFHVTQVGTACAIQELGEVHKVYISGDVSIVSEVTSGIYSILWFPHDGSSFIVEDNANLSVISVNNYMFYSDTEFDILLGENSKSEFELARGFFYYDGLTNHMASSFTLGKSASFTANTGRTASGYSIFRCRDNFVLKEDSMFYLATTSSGTGASLYFPTVANVNFNNPKSVVVYNNGGYVFDFDAGTASNSNKINIDAELVNYWTQATLPLSQAGTFDDPPTRSFSKKNGDNVQAILNTTRSTVSSLTTNIESDDEGYPMTNTTFPILTAKVLSLGNLSLEVDDINDLTDIITGRTESTANLRAKYNSTTHNGTSSAGGEINLPISPRIPVDTVVKFGSNWRFLTKYKSIIVEGTVSITYLPDLVFKSFFAPCRRNTVYRQNPGWYMEVTDTRTKGDLSDWLLYVSMPNPLTFDVFTLDNALILRDGTDKLITPTFILVKQQQWVSPAPIVTRLTWAEIEGFLLKVDPDFNYNAGLYSSQLNWYVKKESEV